MIKSILETAKSHQDAPFQVLFMPFLVKQQRFVIPLSRYIQLSVALFVGMKRSGSGLSVGIIFYKIRK